MGDRDIAQVYYDAVRLLGRPFWDAARMKKKLREHKGYRNDRADSIDCRLDEGPGEKRRVMLQFSFSFGSIIKLFRKILKR